MSISRAIPRIIFFCRHFHYPRVWFRIAAKIVLTTVFISPPFAGATVVRMEMSFGLTPAGNINPAGNIDIELYDDQAPKTVVNFLRYAGRPFNLLAGISGYTDSIIHRHATLVPDGIDVIQGGGFFPFSSGAGTYYYLGIPTDPPVPNEYSLPNARGRIAMALVADQSGNPLPDSATSQWFINVADNSAQLPGYTVFGCVLDPSSNSCTGTGTGMGIVDQIANMQVCDKSADTNPAFNKLPVYNYYPNCLPGTLIKPDNLVFISRIPNVIATTTSSSRTTSAYAADVDVTLSNPNSGGTVDPNTSTTWLKTFIPPPGKVVQFNDEISQFTMTWTTGPASRVVTLYHGAATSVTGYYAYGPTSDNPTPHWYDFSYDAATGTGAEILGNKILLHFVDGQRGDNDTTANSITHIGAPVLVTDIPTSSPTSVGCSISATPSPMRKGGDWIVVAMFLAFVALVRRRHRRDRPKITLH